MCLFRLLKDKKLISRSERNVLVAKFDEFDKKAKLTCKEYRLYASQIKDKRKLVERKNINKKQYQHLVGALDELNGIYSISETILRITLERMEKAMWFKKKEEKDTVKVSIEKNEQLIQSLTIEAEKLRGSLTKFQKDEEDAITRKDRAAFSIARSQQKSIGRELEVNTKALDAFINTNSNLKALDLAKKAANYNRILMAQAGLTDPSVIQSQMYELNENGNSVKDISNEIDSVFNQSTDTDDEWQRALEQHALKSGKEAKEFEEKVESIRKKGEKDNG